MNVNWQLNKKRTRDAICRGKSYLKGEKDEVDLVVIYSSIDYSTVDAVILQGSYWPVLDM